MNRYRDIQVFNDKEKLRKYRTNPMYPSIPPNENDIYIISKEGDRYDILADVFYSDHMLWWIIASANNATVDNLAVQPGLQIRIPADKNSAVTNFLRYNELR